MSQKHCLFSRLVHSIRRLALWLPASLLLLQPAWAQPIVLGGFAFAGDQASVAQRFPNVAKIREILDSTGKKLSPRVVEKAHAFPARSLEYAAIDKQGDVTQQLTSILLFTGETVSSELSAGYYKTFISLRAEALIFDPRNKTIVRSYPISATIFDATERQPGPNGIRSLVSNLLLREDSTGLLTQYAARMGSATLPLPGSHTYQIMPAAISPEAMAMLPPSLRDQDGSTGKVFSDAFGAILAAKLGLSLLPMHSGTSAGNLGFRLDNGDAVDLALPRADYVFEMKIKRFVKARTKAGDSPAGAAFAYGVQAHLRFFETALQKDYLNTDIKSADIKLVPGGQLMIDDLPAYESALSGLFSNVAAVLQHNGDTKWLLAAAAEKNIGTQLIAARPRLKDR